MDDLLQAIEDLKSAGFRVKINHLRRWCWPEEEVQSELYPKHEIRALGCEILATGGETQVSIEAPDGFSSVLGRAVCSVQDNFCRRDGLTLAFDRAVTRMEGVWT